MSNYLSTGELNGLAKIINALECFWNELGEVDVVTVESEGGLCFSVYDTNGDPLGTIAMTDGGTFGFYASLDEPDE